MNECVSCFSDITDENKVKYRINKSKEWHDCKYCEYCVKFLLENSWNIYVNEIKNTDCKKTLASLIKIGPPINLRDKTGFPNPKNTNLVKEVDELYFCSTQKTHSAKLKGSYIGKQRQDYIFFLNNFKN